MASLTICDLDDRATARLDALAAIHGRSAEEEARKILNEALLPPAEPISLAREINALFKPLGGLNIPDPVREPMREPPRFD